MVLMLSHIAQESDGSAASGMFSSFVSLIIAVLVIGGLWKVFTKAGQPGWAAIIPIYNVITLLRTAGRPTWWFLLMLIPVVNLVVAIMVMLDVAKAFGKGTGFALGLIFLAPIFIPLLGFGNARYVGVAKMQSPAFA